MLFMIAVLPRLKEQCSSRAIPLEDLLSEKGYDKILDFIPSLDSVADLKVRIHAGVKLGLTFCVLT